MDMELPCLAPSRRTHWQAKASNESAPLRVVLPCGTDGRSTARGPLRRPFVATEKLGPRPSVIREYPELPLMGALIIATLVYVVDYELSLPDTIMAPKILEGELSSAQSKSIDTILDVSHLMIAWAVAIIGATAFLIRLIVEKHISAYRLDFCILFTVVLAAVVSLYFGHLGIYTVAEMLSLDQFPIGHKLSTEMFARQYALILVSTGLFGIHIVLFFWRLVER